MIGWTRRQRYAASFVGVALIAVACGCASETTGRAFSASTANPSGSELADTSAVEGGSSFEEELASVLPCEVLDDDQVADLGFDPSTAEYDDAGILNLCQYTVGPVETPLMSINIGVDQALDDLNLTNFNSTDHQVGPLRALLITDDRDPNKCQISMEIGESSHVTVRVMLAESQEAACETVERVAVLVEPELPREAR
ncbi:DUF3558 domain-containing protein [Actinoalloteichus spitiensis]|uniref:DUF3558 domain-containing protein n=1 Tax=Actinoalloteichus spitiensis TaxID=252394 RepID=UPI000A028A94|nr:DUF3558 domain-containing protein [Actinoalloteichus spitiensis]